MSGEDIQFDSFPSEIIADEYLHTDNQRGAIYIFTDENHVGNLEITKTALTRYGFDVQTTNQFPIDNRQQVLDDIDKITKENHSLNSCFVLLFLGTIKGKNEEYRTKSGDVIVGAEIWRKVMNCKTLKYRPKIFIFHGFKKMSNITTDAGSFRKVDEPPKYDIPFESDMMVMYKVTEATSSDSSYFKNLWNNITEFGGRDDLLNIIAYTKRDCADNHHPITVSTLRKKFYVTPSQFRLHWYDITKNTEEILCTLKTLGPILGNIQSQTNHTNRSSSSIKDANENKDYRIRTNPTPPRGYSHVKSKVNSFRK